MFLLRHPVCRRDAAEIRKVRTDIVNIYYQNYFEIELTFFMNFHIFIFALLVLMVIL